MKVSVQMEIERAEDLIVLGNFFASLDSGGAVDGSAPIRQPAPAEPKRVGRPKAVAAPPKEQPAAEKPAEPETTAEPPVEQDEGVEEVTREMVAKELREFINRHEPGGAKMALAELKKFDAMKFDQLDPANYSKFLSALRKVA